MPKFVLSLLLVIICSSVAGSVNLEFWQFATDPEVRPLIQTMVDEFESANPEIEVNITDLTWSHGHEKIVMAFASGNAPDVVELGSDWIAQFADAGQLLDISADAAADSSEYQGWSMAAYDDKLYARPWYLGTRVMFYNQDLLGRTAIGRDKMVPTLTHLYAVAHVTNNLGDDIFGWGNNSPEKHRLYKKYLPFLWTNQGDILSDSGGYCIISSVLAIDALTLYVRLGKETGFVGTQRSIEDAFLDGKIGAIMSGDWLLKRIEDEKPDFQFSTSPFPGMVYPGTSFMGGEFLAVSAKSQNSEAAIKLARFMSSPENQVRFCKANRSANPSSREAQNDSYFMSNPHLQTFIRQLNMAKHPPVHPAWVEMEAILEEAIEKAVFKDVDPADALYEAQKKIDALITEK